MSAPMEVIVAAADLSWSCVFSHEAGDHVWEELYERSPDAEPGAVADGGA